MKLLISILFLLIPALSVAGINSINGLYLKGSVVAGSYYPPEGSSFDDTFLPIAVFIQPTIGYRITDFFALESSFDWLKDSHNAGGGDTFDLLGGKQKWGPDHYKLYAFEVAAKAIYPFRCGISVFGKGGVAYVHQNVFNKLYENSEPSIDAQTTQISPLLGIGISHNFTQHFASDLAFTHIHGNDSIGNINTTFSGFILYILTSQFSRIGK